MRSKPSEASGHLGEILTAFEHAVASLAPGSLPALLGALEKLKALAWARAVDAMGSPAPPGLAAALDELRHLTPLQVAELLNLKEAYVHELCRSGRIPATKEGKYWIIPLSGLRDWLRHSRQRVDRVAPQPLPSSDAEDAPGEHTGKRLDRTALGGPAVIQTSRGVDSRRTPARNRRTALRPVTDSAAHGVSSMRSTNGPEPSAAALGKAGARPDSQ